MISCESHQQHELFFVARLDLFAAEDKRYAPSDWYSRCQVQKVITMASTGNMIYFALTALLLYLAFRTASFKAKMQYPSSRPLEKNFPISIYEGLVEVIRFPTISYDAYSAKQMNVTAFEGQRKYIFKRE